MKEIKTYIQHLKLRLSQVDFWLSQTSNMLYSIEEKMADIEDEEIENLLAEHIFTKMHI